MSFVVTDNLPARAGAAAWLMVPAAWSISVVLDRNREWEGSPIVFWLLGAAALVVAGALQLVVVLQALRPARGFSARAAIGVLGLGLAVSMAVGWAIPLWLALYGIGMLIAGAVGNIRIATAIGLGFAVGTGAFALLTILEVGRPDSYGDYPVAGVTALFIATIGAAVGMLFWPETRVVEAERPIESRAG